VVSAARYAQLSGKRAAFITAYETFRAKHDLTAAGVELPLRSVTRISAQVDTSR